MERLDRVDRTALPKGESGRPSYPLMAILRVRLMQNWFGAMIWQAITALKWVTGRKRPIANLAVCWTLPFQSGVTPAFVQLMPTA